MIKSLVRLVSIDSGLDSANVLVLEMTLPQPDFYGPPVRRNFCSDVIERVGTLAGRAVGRRDQPPAAQRGQRQPRLLDRGQDAAARAEPVGGVPLDLSRLLQGAGHPHPEGTRLRRPRRHRRARRRHHQRGNGEAVLAGRGSGRPAHQVGSSERPAARSRRSSASSPTCGTSDSTRPVRREMFRPYSQGAWPTMTVVGEDRHRSRRLHVRGPLGAAGHRSRSAGRAGCRRWRRSNAIRRARGGFR